MLILTENNVFTIKEDDVVSVFNPKDGSFVPCKVEIALWESPSHVFLTTLDSKIDEYVHSDLRYSDYIKHLRETSTNYSVHSRNYLQFLLASKKYYIG